MTRNRVAVALQRGGCLAVGASGHPEASGPGLRAVTALVEEVDEAVVVFECDRVRHRFSAALDSRRSREGDDS